MPIRDNLPGFARWWNAPGALVQAENRHFLAGDRWDVEFLDMAQEAIDKASGKTMKKGKQGEELFHLILSGIREVYDLDATIAGGAVRDLSAGVSDVKDVDVFIPMKYERFFENAPELGWQGPHALVGGEYKGCVVPSTARVSSRVQNTKVDMVFMDEPLNKDMVAQFPVFAQRGVYTLEGGSMLSPECAKDIADKTFTIDPTITDKERMKGILKKVKGWQQREGYHDWKIIEPDLKEWWEAKEEAEKKPPNMSPKDVYNSYMDMEQKRFLAAFERQL
jgi:hypothetical protein